MVRTKPKTQDDWDALRIEISDSFSPGAPVQEADLFAGRIAQIDALREAVLQRGRHAVVFGERGVGKTSLANIISLVLRHPTKELIYVRVNCNPQDSFTSIWKNVFKRMTYSTTDSAGVKIKKSIAEDFPSELTPDDVQLVLEEFSANQVPIIVLDEFDRITDKKTTLLIADTIKALSDYSVNATIVIVGVAEDISALVEGHESITRSLIQIKMPRMSNEEIKQLIITRYSKCGIETDEDAIWKMTFLSRGLPYYAHSISMNAALQSIDKKTNKVLHEDVDKALERSISELDQSIKEKYVLAVKSQRGDDTIYPSVLLACAFAETDELGRFQQVSIAAPLKKITGKDYPASTYAKHMNAFCTTERGSVLQKFGNSRSWRYGFFDPMLQPFVILKGLNEGRLTDEIAEIFSTKPQLELPYSIEN